MTIDQVKKFREAKETPAVEEIKEEVKEELPVEEVKVEVPEEVKEVEHYLSMDLPELRAYAKGKGLKFPGFTGKEKLIKLLEQ
jgi:CO dehydrogenase/acetyl-CoA synthase beta subunit